MTPTPHEDPKSVESWTKVSETPWHETWRNEDCGESKYTEHWSLDGMTYVEVPKWIVKQIKKEEAQAMFEKLKAVAKNGV